MNGKVGWRVRTGATGTTVSGIIPALPGSWCACRSLSIGWSNIPVTQPARTMEALVTPVCTAQLAIITAVHTFISNIITYKIVIVARITRTTLLTLVSAIWCRGVCRWRITDSAGTSVCTILGCIKITYSTKYFTVTPRISAAFIIAVAFRITGVFTRGKRL